MNVRANKIAWNIFQVWPHASVRVLGVYQYQRIITDEDHLPLIPPDYQASKISKDLAKEFYKEFWET